MRTVLICRHGRILSRHGLARWLAYFTDLAGIIVVRDDWQSKRREIKREFRRSGLLGVIDAALFKLYYFFFLSAHDRTWEINQLAALEQRYPAVSADLPVLVTDDPNGRQAREFVIAARCDLLIADDAVLLEKSLFNLSKSGAIIMHPGIFPRYRNAHGCFWALAHGDLTHVGVTLLSLAKGADTEAVCAYYRARYGDKESHRVIQSRAVFSNIEAMQAKLLAIASGQAEPIATNEHAVHAQGQPRLTAYFRWKWRAYKQTRSAKGRRGLPTEA